MANMLIQTNRYYRYTVRNSENNEQIYGTYMAYNDSGVNNLFKASEIYKLIQKYSAQILNQNRFGLVFCAGVSPLFFSSFSLLITFEF